VDGPQSAGSEDQGADDDFADGYVFHEAAFPGMSEWPGVILQGSSGETGASGEGGLAGDGGADEGWGVGGLHCMSEKISTNLRVRDREE
jgi:hypothetical protein